MRAPSAAAGPQTRPQRVQRHRRRRRHPQRHSFVPSLGIVATPVAGNPLHKALQSPSFELVELGRLGVLVVGNNEILKAGNRWGWAETLELSLHNY